MVDPLYGTGEWADGVVKAVPVEVAKKMLKHPDVWAEKSAEMAAVVGIEVEVVEPETTKDDTEAEESQKVRDAIAAMDSKQSIADFIAANYLGIKIDKRGSLDAMKQEAVRIVDQYGVTP
jgi:hypothetical protein